MKVTVNTSPASIGQRYHNMARKIPAALKQVTQELAAEVVTDYEHTTETWQHQPQFDTVDIPLGTMVQTQSQIYKFIDRGTSVRRALMSKDWRSKTRVNVLGSFSGQGRVLYISRKLSLPGIEARNFSRMIQQRVRAKAVARYRKALNEAAAGSGFGL